jgi:hypothetical protein
MKLLYVVLIVFLGIISSCSPRYSYVSHNAWPLEGELGCREDCVNHKISKGIPEQEAVDTCTKSDICKTPNYGQAIENTANEFADNFKEH